MDERGLKLCLVVLTKGHLNISLVYHSLLVVYVLSGGPQLFNAFHYLGSPSADLEPNANFAVVCAEHTCPRAAPAEALRISLRRFKEAEGRGFKCHCDIGATQSPWGHFVKPFPTVSHLRKILKIIASE